MFLEDGVEIFDERDIPVNAEVYISLGENYKDPYASTKSKFYERSHVIRKPVYAICEQQRRR